MLAGSLVLAGWTAGEAQERPGAKAATVMAKLVVLESVAQGEIMAAVVEGGRVQVSSEWDIAGRVPVVMAAHVLPASVTDSRAARREARDEERAGRQAVVSSAGWTASGVPVSRHTVELDLARDGYRGVFYVVVAL